MSDRNMRVRFDIGRGDLRPRYLDGMELPNWEHGPTMVEYLNHMSEQGWRLVAQLRGQEYVFESVNNPQGKQVVRAGGMAKFLARESTHGPG